MREHARARLARGHAEARGRLPQPALVQVQDALHRLGVRPRERRGVRRTACRLQQPVRATGVATHRQHVGHRVVQHDVDERAARGQPRQRGQSGGERVAVAVHHRVQQRQQRAHVRAHRGVGVVFQAAVLQAFHRDGRAAREAVGPHAGHLQQPVRVHQVGRERADPAGEQPHAALLDEGLGVLHEQPRGVGHVAALDRVFDRGHKPLPRLVPAGGGEVQPRGPRRVFAREARAQEVGEEAVVPPRAVLAGQRRDEEVVGLEPLEHPRAVGAGHQRVAQRHVEPVQDARAQQELARGLGLLSEHGLGEVRGHGAVRAREARDEVAARRLPLQRHGRERERRHPALGLVVQLHDRLGRQRQVRAQLEVAFGLGEGEAQVLGVDVEQLAARAQPAEAEVGPRAHADHHAAAHGQVVDQFAHQRDHGAVLDALEVVEEQHVRRRVGREAPHQLGRRGRLGRVGREFRHGLAQAVHEARGVVVGRVEPEPRGGGARGLQPLAHLPHRGGLAEAGGRAHDDDAHRRGGAGVFAQGVPRHLRARRDGAHGAGGNGFVHAVDGATGRCPAHRRFRRSDDGHGLPMRRPPNRPK